MLLSILYWFVRCLLDLIAVLARQDLSKDAELLVLGHENTVLSRQVSGYTTRLPTGRGWPLCPGSCRIGDGQRSSENPPGDTGGYRAN